MGPYRHNAAPLRARREELRLEIDELDAKITELSIARDVVDRAIDDIDVRLQTGFRPRRRPRRPVMPLFFAGVTAVATVLLIMLGVAARPRVQPRCLIAIDSIETLQKAGYTPITSGKEGPP